MSGVDEGGRVVPDVVLDQLSAVLVQRTPYRRWFSVRRPRSRWQRLTGRIDTAVWGMRYHIARRIYPFVEWNGD